MGTLVMTIGTENHGNVEVREDQLATITDEDLKDILGMTREELHECFALGARMMREEDVQPRDRIRPIADQMRDGRWVVTLVQYSPETDPLMEKPEGNA